MVNPEADRAIDHRQDHRRRGGWCVGIGDVCSWTGWTMVSEIIREPRSEMPEYLIFFNDEWVTETSDQGWQQRARDARAVMEEMKDAGVYIFSGGLNNEGSVFHAEPRDGRPVITDGP